MSDKCNVNVGLVEITVKWSQDNLVTQLSASMLWTHSGKKQV